MFLFDVLIMNSLCSVDGKTISVIDPAYEDEVKSKVNEVFSFLGESGVNSLYEKIKCVLEDEKMVSTEIRITPFIFNSKIA